MMQPKKKSRRHRMLAKIHIEKEEQGISEEAYRDLLRFNFGVESATDLNDAELESLIGFIETKSNKERRTFYALKDKAVQTALHSPLNVERWRGLVRKCCHVEDLRFFYPLKRHDDLKRQNRQLKHLLVIMEDMERRGEI